MEITCDTCGKKFNKCKSHITTHNFCSRECRGKFDIPDIYIEFKNGDKKLVEVKAEWAINNERNKIKFKVANDYCLLNNLTFEVWTEKELKIGLR